MARIQQNQKTGGRPTARTRVYGYGDYEAEQWKSSPEDYLNYDDGLDEAEEQEPEELTEEEITERRHSRIRVAFGAGNLLAIVAGTVLILVLVALLLSMINFVSTDFNRNFSLFLSKS